jgi:hypothetical protein
MSPISKLDVNSATWDKFRGAVVMTCGVNQLAISIEALEDWTNRKLSPKEAIEAAIDDGAMFRSIANATPAHDNVITITTGILNSRSWSAEIYDDGPEDSGPIYLETPTERGDYL